MKIKWLGHSCFLLTSNTGVRVLTDPFDNAVGYELPAVEADIVTTSHGHHDHNHVQIVKGSFTHFDKPGIYAKGGIEITGVSSYHDGVKGLMRGKNTMFKFDIGGVKVCHCGDLGHALTARQVEELGEVDVLLVPVGGIYTLDGTGAFEIVKLLKPSIVIPMHFKTEALAFQLDGADKFLSAAGGGGSAGSQEIEVDSESLPESASVILLEYR